MIKTMKALQRENKLMRTWNGVKHAYIEHPQGRTRIETSLKELTNNSNEISITAIKLIKRYDFNGWMKIMKKGIQLNYKHWAIEWKSIKNTTVFSILNTKTGETYTSNEKDFNYMEALNQLSDKAIINLVSDMVLYGTLTQEPSKNVPSKKVRFESIEWGRNTTVTNK